MRTAIIDLDFFDARRLAYVLDEPGNEPLGFVDLEPARVLTVILDGTADLLHALHAEPVELLHGTPLDLLLWGDETATALG